MPDDNPLTNPAGNLPGVTVEDKNDLHHTYEQEYYEPGGKRKKGENRGTDYTGGLDSDTSGT